VPEELAHVNPPSVVLITIPAVPTAQPRFWFRKKTLLRSVVCPELMLVQVFPPSVDHLIIPFRPTITPVVSLVKQTPLKPLFNESFTAT
jgi:hypothetical protein